MTDTRTAWGEVGDNLSALLLKLKLHAEEELSDDDVREKCGLDRVTAVLEETAEAMSDAYEDEAVRADAREVARSFVAAVDTTFREAQTRMRPGG
ncbi:hypothetical protein NHL50_02170 [Acidimicrobiia bacterium EGI L10123]|uniref:hypothetical protein n=1 Tax=Salinilacustrithrix flava TaxID=2957203 RepID=UPI003D7C16F4|nr:hypothetical protein [Acidimicrobiia bacterium EGI L10123]